MARYVDGFVMAVPKTKMQEYRRMAQKAGKLWCEHGAIEYVECMGDDMNVKMGVTFPKMANVKRNETVVFSYIVFSSRAHRDRVNAKVMKDERMQKIAPKNMPFDEKRMAYGGFKSFVECKPKSK